MSRGNYKKPPKPAKVDELKGLAKLMKSTGCSHCGKEGPHMVPPSAGDPAFFICMTDDEITEVFTQHRKEMDSQQELRDKLIEVCYDAPTETPVTDEIQKEVPNGSDGFYF